MRVLLIYPPGWIRYNLLPPMGIAFISATLEKFGINTVQRNMELDIVYSNKVRKKNISLRWITRLDSIVEFIIDNNYFGIENFVSFLEGYEEWENYDAVGFSILGELQLRSSFVIAKFIKSVNRKIKIILGGPFLLQNYNETIRLANEINLIDKIDVFYGIDDGGEKLAEMLINKKLKKYIREKKNYNVTNYPTPNFNFDVKIQRELSSIIYKMKPKAPMLQYPVSKGCKYKCPFCTRGFIPHGNKNIKDIVKDILFLSEKFDTEFIKFESDTLNINEEWILTFADELIKNKSKVKWNSYLRIQPFTKRMAYLLREAGGIVLRFGVESGSNKVLKKIRKGYSVEDVERTLKLSKEYGFWNGVLFMVATPGETEKDVRETVNFIKKNSRYIDSILINVFTLLKGTTMYKYPEKFGMRIINSNGIILFEDLEARRDIYEQAEFSEWAYRKVAGAAIEEGIGLTGTSPDLIHLSLINFNGEVGKAHKWMLDNFPQFLKPYPHHFQRWLLYHSNEREPYPDYSNPTSLFRLGYKGIDTPKEKKLLV